MRLFKSGMKATLALVMVISLSLGGLVILQPAAIPPLVDLARAVIGPQPVAFAENLFYGAEDALQRRICNGCTTPGYWSTTDSKSASIPKSAQGIVPARSALPLPPPNVSPLYPSLAAPGEGVWQAMPNPFDPTAPLLYKTFLHPDPARGYARVAIVAIDLTRVRLHEAAGTVEPASSVRATRTGLVPASDLTSLVATFNGGFKAVNGHFGMMVDGQMILPPQPNADTIAIYRDGHVRIAPWSAIADTLPQMQSFRQTPPYMIWHGAVNRDLLAPATTLWGAYVDGSTVIWRSALGLSASGTRLFYAVGESLTARRLAEALVAAGASDAAELDVNRSFDHFLTYAPTNGKYGEQALMDNMIYRPGMCTMSPSSRDFFYLTLAATRAK